MIQIDMEMPESCYRCGRWRYDEWYMEYRCIMKSHDLKFFPDEDGNEDLKSENCPLIEVKE